MGKIAHIDTIAGHNGEFEFAQARKFGCVFGAIFAIVLYTSDLQQVAVHGFFLLQ
jgi:hypothetical protein